MKPGTRVICVDDVDTLPNMDEPPDIVEGDEYVIRWFGPYTHIYEGCISSVRLVGVRRPDCPATGESDVPFAARRFVPAVTIEEKQKEELRA